MKKFMLILILFSLCPSIIFAKDYEVDSTGEYVMGDRDTKVDARRIALEHAKLLAVEQIGTYLESETIVRDSQVTKEEIRTYSSAIVKTTVLSEDMRLLENKTAIFSLKIRAAVDIAMLDRKIKEIKSDERRSRQIASLQAENIKLLKELESISTKLKSETSGQYKKLRQERENVLEKLDNNQKSIRIAFEKGSLLNLAIKNKDELEENKKQIDDVIQFLADHTEFTLGKPQIRNKGDKSDLVINVEWNIRDRNELVSKFDLFFTAPDKNYFDRNLLFLEAKNFKGINKEKLRHYFNSRRVSLKVQAARWQTSTDINNVIGIVVLKGESALTFSDIPTDQLDQITGIEAKVVIVEPESAPPQTKIPSAGPKIKKKRLAK